MSAPTLNVPGTLSWPKINGTVVSFAQMSLELAGLYGTAPLQVIDAQSVDYSDKVDVRLHHMTSSFPVARYGRQMRADATIEFGIETHRAVTKLLVSQGAGGISDTVFDLVIVYQLKPGSQVMADILHGCRLIGNGQRNVVGGKHLTTTCPMSVLWVEWNATGSGAVTGATTGIMTVAEPAPLNGVTYAPLPPGHR